MLTKSNQYNGTSLYSNSSDSEDIPEPYSGVGHHFKVLYTRPVSELLAECTAHKVLGEVQNDTELPVPPVIAVEKIDCASLSSNLSKKKTMTRWPQMTSLMKDAFYSHQILRMLQGCYEAECVEVPAAKDGPDVKGNAWIKFHDLCFGGGELERGLVKEFPVIDRPTKLKEKSFPFGNMLSHK